MVSCTIVRHHFRVVLYSNHIEEILARLWKLWKSKFLPAHCSLVIVTYNLVVWTVRWSKAPGIIANWTRTKWSWNTTLLSRKATALVQSQTPLRIFWGYRKRNCSREKYDRYLNSWFLSRASRCSFNDKWKRATCLFYFASANVVTNPHFLQKKDNVFLCNYLPLFNSYQDVGQ